MANCNFCNTRLEYCGMGEYLCRNHNIHIYFTEHTVSYEIFVQEGHMFVFHITSGKFSIVRLNPRSKIIFSDYANKYNLTPENSQSFLERLLKQKAFL